MCIVCVMLFGNVISVYANDTPMITEEFNDNTAVSYTHLDVYKRQRLNIISAPFSLFYHERGNINKRFVHFLIFKHALVIVADF